MPVILPDRMTVAYPGGGIRCFGQSEAPFDVEILEEIKSKLTFGEVEYFTMKSTEKDMSFTVWIEDGTSFFGILDSYNETAYYHHGDSDSRELVPVCGNLYQERYLCRNFAVLTEAIDHFAVTLEPSPKVRWLVE